MTDTPDQPIGLEETINGAFKRAEKALLLGDMGIGIEAGLVESARAKSGYLDIHFCVVSDSVMSSLGSSMGFEYPPEIIQKVLGGYTVEEAIEDLTGIKGIGRDVGAVGFLTNNRIKRLDLCKQSLEAAFISRRSAGSK